MSKGGSGSVGVRGINNKEREIAAEKCRSAVLHAVGTYMVSRLNMAPTLRLEDSSSMLLSGSGNGNGNGNGNNGNGNLNRNGNNGNGSGSGSGSRSGGVGGMGGVSGSVTKKRKRVEEIISPVVGLEEMLVPYYVRASRDLYYCRLFI